jgi:hypothetical protein
MPNDAKLGLVVGLSLVIVVAVFFFRAEAPANDPAAATIVKTPSLAPAREKRPVEAKAAARAAEVDPSEEAYEP